MAVKTFQVRNYLSKGLSYYALFRTEADALAFEKAFNLKPFSVAETKV